MHLKNICLGLIAAATLAACNKETPEDAVAICSAEATQAAFQQQFKDNMLKSFQQFKLEDKQLVDLNLDSVRTDLEQLQFSLSNFNAQSLNNDKNVNCIAQLNIHLSNEMLLEAQDKAKKLDYGFDVNRDANLNGFEVFINNDFKTPVQYAVNTANNQIISEDRSQFGAIFLKNLLIIRNVNKNPYEGMVQPGYEVASDISASVPTADPLQSLLDSIEADSEAKDASASATAATEAGTPVAPVDTNLQANKQQNQQARQQIDKIWGNLPAEIKDTLKEEEQNWKNNRIKSCAVEGSEAQQLECETKSINKRIKELKQYSVD